MAKFRGKGIQIDEQAIIDALNKATEEKGDETMAKDMIVIKKISAEEILKKLKDTKETLDNSDTKDSEKDNYGKEKQ